MTMSIILALDFGGTKHSVGVVAQGGREWLAHGRVAATAGANATTDLLQVLALAMELLAGRQPSAVGVSFGGPVDFARGVVRLSHHVPGWEEVPLAARLEEAFGAPAVVDNDANVAALGEHRYGAGRGVDHLLYVTVSTGVGGGWILDGRPWRGAQGMAGEIGHMVVDPAGPHCLCGKRGCVERLASGPYMAADAAAWVAEDAGASGRGAILRELAGREPITGALLSQAAAQGDDIAHAVLARGARALGLGLGNAANLVNPQRIILGGGVTKAGELWWQTVRQTVAETILPEVEVEVVPAGLGDDAPLWGAVALGEERASG